MNPTIDPKILLSQSAPAPGTRPARGNDPEALRRVCQEFEAVLTQALFKGMRATLPTGGLIDKGMGTEVFEELMDVEIARQAARGQGLGIAEVLYRQLQGDLPGGTPESGIPASGKGLAEK